MKKPAALQLSLCLCVCVYVFAFVCLFCVCAWGVVCVSSLSPARGAGCEASIYFDSFAALQAARNEQKELRVVNIKSRVFKKIDRPFQIMPCHTDPFH